MQLLTDDSRFGIQLTPQRVPRFFRIRLLLDGFKVGDFEPAIVWQDLSALAGLAEFQDPRLDPRRFSAREIHDVLTMASDLHDLALVGVGESFDQWSIRGFVFGADVVLLWSKNDLHGTPNPAMTVVPRSEFLPLVHLALHYCEELEQRYRQRDEHSL
jgi:hypothetical protein